MTDIDSPTSQTAAISGGLIEYAAVGDGPAILVSHGTLGGYDQALAVSQLFDQTAFRFLAGSRAGYLRSSPATGRTPEEQARSYVELLDHEGISSAAMIGLSGGAPSAIHFAQEYPQRCRALVLISAIALKPPPLPPFFQLAIRTQDLMMRFDPLWALAHRFGLKLLARSNGVSPSQVRQVFQDPHLRSVIAGIFQPIKTASDRRAGLRLDGAQIEALPSELTDPIDVPTLIGHAANDPLASPADAARLAKAIPGAQYIEFPDGGHLFFVVHSAELIPRIERFLLANLHQ